MRPDIESRIRTLAASAGYSPVHQQAIIDGVAKIERDFRQSMPGVKFEESLHVTSTPEYPEETNEVKVSTAVFTIETLTHQGGKQRVIFALIPI